MDFATIFKTFNAGEANMIASRLEAAGFQPHVANELSSLGLGSAISAGVIRVQVPEAQSIEARAIVESILESRLIDDEDERGPATEGESS